MKSNELNHLPCIDRSAPQTTGFSCQKFFDRLNAVKAAVLAEFRERLDQHDQLLRRALNEAEALAWQTPYPHLLFPTLAVEKAQAVAAWSDHQRSVRRTTHMNSLLAYRR